MDLAIITVSYNTRDLLADCLTSVLRNLEGSALRAEVWVVDNASADGSAEMVRQQFPTVRLLAHEENAGFAVGNNLALQEIGFPLPSSNASNVGSPEDLPRHVLFLNPDTRVLGDALDVMVGFLDKVPQAGAAGARLVHGDGGFQHSAFAFPGLAQVFFDFFPVHPRLVDSRLNGRYPRRLYEGDEPFPVDHPLGAALMVRREALVQVGGFDERFFMYCEEIDLCRRIRAAGWAIYCVPHARIVHLVGQSTQQFRDRMFVALWRSRYLMFDKHNGPLFRWLVRRLVRLGLWAEARRARAAHKRRSLSSRELEGRLDAFREVASL
jgi:N-acetylglucosaminyl-diphospho-decaprenol L-rhamnosyltransferase